MVKQHVNIGIILFVFFVCAACLHGCRHFSYEGQHPELPALPEAFFVGTDSCIPCHDDVYRHYKQTVHAQLQSDEVKGMQRGCETCHGPGSMHVQTKRTGDIISFSHLTAAQSSAVCLQCHRGDPVMDWRANRHVMSGVGCNECHKSHKITAPKMVYRGDPEICFSCHEEKRAQHLLPSHHPVKEGKMRCSSCHNNHGSENNNLKKLNRNDICFECHAEYQGPFVYEHVPVIEDCTICHDPHGTIADNLLRQNEPFLCLRCHKGHRPNPKTGNHPSMASLMTSCVQCHAQIHGSDLPSQVKGGGLTR
ncbi:MAG: GSU2203 family decaheme c-type cytochrome [Desulfobacterota bacterium]|nr:GSU2203 family decaheme c-type cytochrome [Thermodesulfobacteriota bacterium]